MQAPDCDATDEMNAKDCRSDVQRQIFFVRETGFHRARRGEEDSALGRAHTR